MRRSDWDGQERRTQHTHHVPKTLETYKLSQPIFFQHLGLALRPIVDYPVDYLWTLVEILFVSSLDQSLLPYSPDNRASGSARDEQVSNFLASRHGVE